MGYITKPLRYLFQWSDEEEKAGRYASSFSISFVWIYFVSANMADNDNEADLHRGMEAQEKTLKAP